MVGKERERLGLEVVISQRLEMVLFMRPFFLAGTHRNVHDASLYLRVIYSNNSWAVNFYVLAE